MTAIVFLIFCSGYNAGRNCVPPQRMESMQVCQAVGRSMAAAANETQYATFRCLRIIRR